MNLRELQKNWHKLGKQDPLWAIITCPEKKGNKWELEGFFELGRNEIRSVMEYIEKLGLRIRRRRALDFGCGVGRLTQALALYFEEVVGVDIAPSMVRLANKYNRFGTRCKYYLNEAADLRSFESESFDFIYTNIVLQHMHPEYGKSYICEFLRLLNSQGVLIFQIPSEKIQKSPGCEASNGSTRSDLPKSEQPSGTWAQLKQLIKRVIPIPVLKLYVNVRYWERRPIMEMYCIKTEEVESFLRDKGARIVHVGPDDSAGPGWKGFRYCVAKR